MPDMGGASYKLRVYSACVCTSATVAALLKANSGVLCRERKKMATAPEEAVTTELNKLTVEDEDYNPFTEEGKNV